MESSSSSGPLKRPRMSSGTQIPSCLVDGCISDLSKSRDYHRRHKVCEIHSKTPIVFIKGQELRFCQQCSRFHSLVEFDEGKRSCRKLLDGHNRRRRKPQPEPLSANSAGLFHQGTRFLSFGNSQVYSSSSVSSALSGNFKPENDPVLYENQSSLNFIGTKNLFPGSLPQSIKGKQFQLLQGTDTVSSLPGDSACQPRMNTDSVSGNSGSNQKLFSDGLNYRVVDSNRALSLLSSPPTESREIGLSHMVDPDRNPVGPPLITASLSYNDGSSNGNLEGQGTFQIGNDGSYETGSHHALSFSWE